MRSLFLLFFLLITTLSQAQSRIVLNNRISLNNEINNGIIYGGYTTKTDSYSIYGIGNGYVSMTCSEYNGGNFYTINPTFDGYSAPTYEIGRVMLLKLKNGEILTLRNIERVGPNDYTYSQDSNRLAIYYTCPVYAVTTDEIQQIIEGEIIKLRVETDIRWFDIKIKRNRFSRAILKCYQSLQEKSDITNLYDNF